MKDPRAAAGPGRRTCGTRRSTRSCTCCRSPAPVAQCSRARSDRRAQGASACQLPQALMRELVARAEQIADLLQREPNPLGGVNDRQPAKHICRVPPLARHPLGLWQQPPSLLVADPRRTHPDELRHLADRQLSNNLSHTVSAPLDIRNRATPEPRPSSSGRQSVLRRCPIAGLLTLPIGRVGGCRGAWPRDSWRP